MLLNLGGNFYTAASILERSFVRCPEYRGCPYFGGWNYTIYMEITVGATACVGCTEVSECPLLEVFVPFKLQNCFETMTGEVHRGRITMKVGSRKRQQTRSAGAEGPGTASYRASAIKHGA